MRYINRPQSGMQVKSIRVTKFVAVKPFSSPVNVVLMAGSLRAWLKYLLGKSADFGFHGCGELAWSFIRIADKMFSLAV